MSWGSLVSGIIGGIHNRSDRLSGREQATQQSEKQDYWLSHGIRERVWDAKQAGIHPLFALGANVGGYSPGPIAVGDTSFARDIGDAVDSFGSRGARAEAADRQIEMHEAQLDVMRSEAARNDAIAQQAQASILARGAQSANVTQDGTIITPAGVQSRPLEVTPVPKDGKFRSAWGPEIDMDPNYDMNHSQLAQDRWGEPGEWLEGLPLYLRDVARSISDEWKEKLRNYMEYKFGHGR